MTKNLILDSQRHKVKPNTSSKNEKSNKLTPNDILLYSLDNLSPIADENKYRDSQPHNMQRGADLIPLSPKWTVSIKSLLSVLRAP